MNVDSSLIIEEILGGGDGLAYKARRKNGPAKPSMGNRISKLFGIESKADETTPMSQKYMEDMDTYYTVYNWELPNQIPMKMPAASLTTSGNISKGSIVSSVANSSSPQVLIAEVILEKNGVLDDPKAGAEEAPIVSEKEIEVGSNKAAIAVKAIVKPAELPEIELINAQATQNLVAGITEPMNSTGVNESQSARDIPPQIDSHQETESISGSNNII